jgi:hypothetical protein
VPRGIAIARQLRSEMPMKSFARTANQTDPLPGDPRSFTPPSKNRHRRGNGKEKDPGFFASL